MGGKGKQRLCECRDYVYTGDWHQHCLSKHKGMQKNDIQFQIEEVSQLIDTKIADRFSQPVAESLAATKRNPFKKLAIHENPQKDGELSHKNKGFSDNHDVQSLSNEGNESKSTQPTIAGIFMVPRQKELLGSIKLCPINEQVNSVSADTISSANTSKDKDPDAYWEKREKELLEQMVELKAGKNKLEEKLEVKDCELIQLRSQVGGLEVQCLKIKLTEATVRLEERNNQLIEVKQQLKEWTDTANKLINGRADFDEWKKQFQRMSTANSAASSLNQSLVQSQENSTSLLIQTEQEHSDVEMYDLNGYKESQQYFQLPQREQLFGFQNIGLTCYAGAALQCVQVLEYYLTGQLLFKSAPYQNKLEQFYAQTFQFDDIKAQNDSYEAFSRIISQCSWSSKLDFKQTRYVACRKCDNKTIAEEFHNGISLQCDQKSLGKCLKSFLKPELLQGSDAYKCEICSENTEADTFIKISGTNDIVVVNLKRHIYKGVVLKNNCVITVPFEMTIDSCRYELIAFVVHCDSKTANKGHYKAYIHCATDWYEFDDDRVRAVAPKQLENFANQGYYYCYRRFNESQQRGLSANLAGLIEAVRPSVVHCSFCNSDFEHSGAKFQHWKDCQGLKQANERVADRYNVFAQTASEKEKELIQTVLDIEGGGVKSAISKINLIQQRGSADFKKKFVDDLDSINLARLHDELHDSKYFNALVHHTIVGPVTDAEGNPVYAQNSTRKILISMLGKTNSRKSTSSLEKEVILKMKKESGITLTLDERRSLEADEIKTILQKHESDIMHVRDYLSGFKEMRSSELFKKVKATFCDGMILPRLEQLFKTYNNFQAAFHSAGIQVQKICPGQKEGFVYVRLQDSANEFDAEFVLKLNAFILSLRRQLGDLDEDREVVDACFVQQIDYTQDMKGFFLSFDVKGDIKQLSELMSMDLTHDYPTFESLFTLIQKKDYGTEEVPLMLKSTRFKIYNKLLHFLESEQGKKKISMNLKALLNCSSEFYQKLLECFEFGLSRLEFSHYFYSFQESQKICVAQYQFQVDHAFEKVNQLPQIRYRVPFKMFFDCFWNCSRPVFIFQRDSWTVVYAKHSISAYVGQTVLITQDRFNNKDKIECIKRFGIPEKLCTVIDRASGKVYKVLKTGSMLIQIPIQSLNTVHAKSYDFPFHETTFRYYMSANELDQISLVDEKDQQFTFEDMKNVPTENKRDQKSREKEEKRQMEGTDITKFTILKHTKQGNVLTINLHDFKACCFKTNSGGSRGDKLYQCKQPNCALTVKKMESKYYLLGTDAM